MALFDLLGGRGFITVNKFLAKTVGLHGAILLGELISEFQYWQKESKLDEYGDFFSTVENIEDNTTLSGHQQREAFKVLESFGMVTTIKRGIPAKRFIHLNEKCIEGLLLNNLTTGDEEIKPLVVKKFNTNNNNNKNKKKNNITKGETPLKKSKQDLEKDKINTILDEYEGKFSETVLDLAYQFFADRVNRGDKVTETQVQMQLEEFAGKKDVEIIASIKTSIASGYKGIFFSNNQRGKKTYTDTAHYTEEERAHIDEMRPKWEEETAAKLDRMKKRLGLEEET